MSDLFGFGQMGAAGIQSLANIGMTMMTNSANAKEADRARRHQVVMARNRHQWNVESLRAAGLNPVLSAGASPPSSAGSAPQATFTAPKVDAASAYATLRNQKLQAKILDAEYFKKRQEGIREFANAKQAMFEAARDSAAYEAWSKKENLYGEMKALQQATGDSNMSTARGIGGFLKKLKVK